MTCPLHPFSLDVDPETIDPETIDPETIDPEAVEPHYQPQPVRRTDQEWIAALQGKLGTSAQHVAFNQLTSYQFVVVLRYLTRRKDQSFWLSQISHEEIPPLAQDIVQSCLERLAKDDCALLSQFQGRGSFTGWAAQIALNMARSELRRVHWHRSYPLADVVYRSGGGHSEPDRVLARQELSLALNQCLAELSETYRTVIVRCVLNGERACDVAADLGRSVQAVYNLIDRAKRKLLDLLEKRQIGLEDLVEI